MCVSLSNLLHVPFFPVESSGVLQRMSKNRRELCVSISETVQLEYVASQPVTLALFGLT